MTVSPRIHSEPARVAATQPPEAPVLVATDGKERSDGAVRAAFGLAKPGTELRLIAVLPSLPIVTPEAQLPITPEFLSSRRAELHRDIERQIERIGLPEDRKVVFEIIDGDPAATIVRAARRTKARLIVAGLGRHRMIDRLFGAETTLSLMRTASVPVLAVGPRYKSAPMRIVVGTDFSEPSLRAARHAVAIAGAGAVIDLVHVAPGEIGPVWKAWNTEYERNAKVMMTKLEAKLRVPDGITINHVLLRGDPAPGLLDHAAEIGADLIATGSHGHGFVARMLIGSVATQVVRASTVAVLAVPHMAALRQEDTAGEESSVMLLPRDDWDLRLDHFTRRNGGRPVVIEVEDPEIGARAQEHGYPLAGVSYDRHDHQVHVMLGALGDRKRHLSRNIGDVTSIDVITDGLGRDLGLRISHGAGETVVSFTR
jgi:nucleotide-binding universal stress UspA family protein